MKRFNILYISSSLAWGGAEISAVKLARAMKERRHNLIFAAHPKGQIIKELMRNEIEVIKVRLIRNFDPIAVFKLIRVLKKKKIDIIHVHMSRDLVHVFWALKFISRKPHVILQKQVSSKVLKKDYFHKKIYSIVSKIFVLSNFLRENVLYTCPVTDDKVVVIHGGIDLSKYEIGDKVREKLRTELNIPNNSIVFGTIARIDRAKGLIELVQAFSKLVENNKDIRLIIVGEPTVGEETFFKELKNQVSKLKVQELVLFTGFRSDIPEILSVFDIFVLASYGEAFGYVLLEASAAKLPIIATDSGGVRDIVEDGKTGILVESYDVESLFRAMDTLIKNVSLRKKLGCAGRKRMEARFTKENILDKIEQEYQSLLDD